MREGEGAGYGGEKINQEHFSFLANVNMPLKHAQTLELSIRLPSLVHAPYTYIHTLDAMPKATCRRAVCVQ